MDINLNELICDNFVDVVNDIIQCNVGTAVLKGGRASTKSQVTSEAILVGCMVYKQSAVACVKYANKIRERLVDTFSRSIIYLGVEKWWKLRKSPFEYVLLDDKGRETNVSIRFTGADKPENLKSYTARAGTCFRYIWFEETTNFDSLKEINILTQSFARGKGDRCIIMTYNPPLQSSNWVNKEHNHPKDKDSIISYTDNQWYEYFDFEFEPGNIKKLIKVVHSSTYLDVIRNGHADWLGPIFIGQAKQMEVENNKMYRWAYLGEVVGTDANVFSNVHDWDGDTSKLDITEVLRGLDYGLGGPDPNAFCAWYYDRRNKRIYALSEFGRPKMSIDNIAYELRQVNSYNFPVYADSATPILNNELITKGLNIVPAIKGHDSILAGIKFLQGLNGIYICKTLTPGIYTEFNEYEYVIDKNDNVTSKLPDKHNHYIDSTRYAFNLEIMYAV